MFASYPMNTMYPGDSTNHPICMLLFGSQASPPSLSTNLSPASCASDDTEISVTDSSSGLDDSWATPSPHLQQYQQLRQLYSIPYLPFWYYQWSQSQVTERLILPGNTNHSSECEKSLGFPPEYNLPPMRPFTPVFPEIEDKKIIPTITTPTTTVRVPSQLHPTRSKSQRSFMLLEMIIDLLSNANGIIGWISTTSPEFRIRDRKKFTMHWNRLSGKQDSFMAIACKLRFIGNEKMQANDGQKIRLITRIAPYTYRFLPDLETSSFHMLHDHILQRLVTKMLLSFHLHLRKCKNEC